MDNAAIAMTIIQTMSPITKCAVLDALAALLRVEVAYLDALHHDPCAYCGGGDFWRDIIGIDHIEPQSVGGVDDETNLTGSCRRCNSSKCAEPMLLFLLRHPDWGAPWR